MPLNEDPFGMAYMPLRNSTPSTSVGAAPDTLRELSTGLQNMRSQSRLGMLDTQIGGPRKRQGPAGEPGIPQPDIPSGGGFDDPEGDRLAYAKKLAAGSSGFKPAPGTFKSLGGFMPEQGTFMPTGSTQQMAPRIAEELRQQGMV